LGPGCYQVNGSRNFSEYEKTKPRRTLFQLIYSNLKSPGACSPGIFAPIRPRTRCRDHGGRFTRSHDKNGIHGHQGRDMPIIYHYSPVIIPGFCCYTHVKLQNALYGLFMLYSYIIIHRIIARYSAFYGVM
jgi:hypothetical protein